MFDETVMISELSVLDEPTIFSDEAGKEIAVPSVFVASEKPNSLDALAIFPTPELTKVTDVADGLLSKNFRTASVPVTKVVEFPDCEVADSTVKLEAVPAATADVAGTVKNAKVREMARRTRSR